MFRSATFKLTMYYLLIIAVISIGFSAALYQVVSNDLALGLQQQTQRISDDFPVFSNSPYLRFGDELDEGRQHLVGRLIICNILVLTAAGFASYALARRTLRPIEAAHDRQKRFTADVSHELRTPLTALKMESEVALLDSSISKSQLRETLSSNIEEAEKLTLLVSNLLRLTQLDDGENLTPHTVIPLQEAIDSALKQLSPIAQRRNITLIMESRSQSIVYGDQATLAQLFVILLDNAVKYSPNGSTVTLTSTVSQHNAVVRIADAGTGIPKADLTHVFERFYRADTARVASENGGFGLGLSIAKLIADSHQASISLTSKPGKGTTAQVAIPEADQLTTQLPS